MRGTYKLSVSTQNGISSTDKMEIWNTSMKKMNSKSITSQISKVILSVLKLPRTSSLCLRSSMSYLRVKMQSWVNQT